MPQKRQGQHHTQLWLAIVGEDGQEKDRVGMEVQRLQPVVVKDLIKEIGEGRNQPDGDAAREEGEEGASLGLRHIGGDPELRLPFLVALPRRQQARKRVAARLFSETLGASRAGSNQAGDEAGLTFRGAIARRCGRG